MTIESENLKIPQDLRYTNEHLWVRTEGQNVRVGVTDFFIDIIGHVLAVDLPERGTAVNASTEIAVLTSSVEGMVEVYAPLDGVVKKVNEALSDEPELVMTDPYDEGWLCVISGVDEDELDNLLTPEDYQDNLSEF